MPTATFYLILPDSAQATPTGFAEYVLYLTRHFVAQGARIYLQCQDKQHAEQLAELFWQVTPDQFMAHNLVGEGPKSGTPIEIGYVGITPSWNRQLAINLADNQTTFARTFAEVIDFVPDAENAKQLARERYKLYRQAGYQLQTVEIQHP